MSTACNMDAPRVPMSPGSAAAMAAQITCCGSSPLQTQPQRRSTDSRGSTRSSYDSQVVAYAI